MGKHPALCSPLSRQRLLSSACDRARPGLLPMLDCPVCLLGVRSFGPSPGQRINWRRIPVGNTVHYSVLPHFLDFAVVGNMRDET